MSKRKPVVGERLYSLNIRNRARHAEQKLTPTVVVKVGRKYFFTEEAGSIFSKKYHLGSWAEVPNYWSNSKLYESADDWNNEKLKSDLLLALFYTFTAYSKKEEFTIDQLKAVCEILNIEVRQ